MDKRTMTLHTLGRRTTASLIIAASLLLGFVTTVEAQVSVGVGLPGASIGINLGAYPDLYLISGYPVYYDPRVDSNYFYYDGMYWVYQGDNWYSSAWYNGPWQSINPEAVPLFVLRVPVRYYRQPPSYFRGWSGDAPPHWGEHWGRSWEEHRAGWDRWDPRSRPEAAPLPEYQRQYSKDRYPATTAQQRSIQSAHYPYQRQAAATQQNSPQVRASIPQPASTQTRAASDQGQQRPSAHQPTQPVPEPPQVQGRQTEHAPQNNARERQPAPDIKARQTAGEQRVEEKKSGEDRGGRDHGTD